MTKIEDIREIMRKLRDPENGCPWDLEQTFKSIVPHTIEEAYEVADCIEREDLASLPVELGDLLFQVVFYAQLGNEQKLFDFEDIVAALASKLTERHPHVFGDVPPGDRDDQARRWESHKAHERALASTGRVVSELDGVPVGLPALSRANKLQKRAARVGFDWPNSDGVRHKVMEEFKEVEVAVKADSKLQIEEEMGDLLFACVNWARHLGLEPESTLRAATRKFQRRFNFIERALIDAGTNVDEASLETMDELWDAAKIAERRQSAERGKKRVYKHP